MTSDIPSFPAMLAEGRIAGEWVTGRIASRRIAARHRGGGRGVLVLPGFLADDRLTRLSRLTLARAGYRPEPWTLGRNEGISADLLDRLVARLEAVATDGPVALVGWSLGGLYARELAKRRPHLAERVVTMGSPFSGDPRANRVWRLYERVAGHPVDAPPIDAMLSDKPPVPTIALWSRGDGIVAPSATRGLDHERDVAVEVRCSHMGFVAAPPALSALLDALALPFASRARMDA